MRIIIGLVALLLALFTGWLASLTFGPALQPGIAESVPGQLRGLAFTLAMAVITIVLLWVAGRSFGVIKPRS